MERPAVQPFISIWSVKTDRPYSQEELVQKLVRGLVLELVPVSLVHLEGRDWPHKIPAVIRKYLRYIFYNINIDIFITTVIRKDLR